MAGEHVRDVLIRLKLEVEKQTATGAGREVETVMRKVEQQTSRTAAAMTRVAKGPDWGPIIRDAQKYGMSLQQLRGHLTATERASLKLYLTNQKLIQSQGTQQQQNRRTIDILRQQEREATDAARAQERAASVTVTSQLAASRALRRSASGAMSLVRSFAMLSASSDEDLEKVIRKLIVIQVAFSGLRGAWQLIEGLVRAWRHYTRAVTAAAAAQTALAIAQARTTGTVALSAASGSNVVRYGLGAAGGGVVGGAVGGAGGGAGAMGAMGAAVAIAIPAAIGTAITGVLAGIAALISKDFRTMILDAFDAIGKDRELKGRFTEQVATLLMTASVRQEIFQGQTAIFRAKLQGGGLSPQQALQQAAQSYQTGLQMQRQGQPGGLGAIAESSRQHITALEAIKRTEEESGRAKLRSARESLNLAKQELRMTQQKFQVEMRLAEKIKEERLSAKERFGQASPVEQQRLIQIKQKADRGEALTREERMAMRTIGLGSTTAIARYGDISAAERAGYGRFFGAEERRAEQAARRKAAEYQASTTADLRRPIDELFRKIDVDFQEQAKAIADAVDRSVQSLKTSIQTWTIREIESRAKSRNLRGILQRNAARAG